MKILIVGANGQIGRHLVDLLTGGEHKVRAMIRNPLQVPPLEAQGAEVMITRRATPHDFQDNSLRDYGRGRHRSSISA